LVVVHTDHPYTVVVAAVVVAAGDCIHTASSSVGSQIVVVASVVDTAVADNVPVVRSRTVDSDTADYHTVLACMVAVHIHTFRDDAIAVVDADDTDGVTTVDIAEVHPLAVAVVLAVVADVEYRPMIVAQQHRLN
jgi:hypothetical protein